MTTIRDVAEHFFEACETGRGWAECKSYCTPDATFSAQTDVLAGITTLEGYTDWMRDLLTPLPDGLAHVQAFAVDDDRRSVVVYGTFTGTHTGPGGPVDPTGRSASADYVYAMTFDGDRIDHLTKVWNDAHTMAQLGWA